MPKFSSNKDIDNKVKDLIKNGWSYQYGKKHNKIISPKGFRLSIPCTPSDWRAFYNFKRDVQHLMTREPDCAI